MTASTKSRAPRNRCKTPACAAVAGRFFDRINMINRIEKGAEA